LTPSLCGRSNKEKLECHQDLLRRREDLLNSTGREKGARTVFFEKKEKRALSDGREVGNSSVGGKLLLLGKKREKGRGGRGGGGPADNKRKKRGEEPLWGGAEKPAQREKGSG